MVSLFPVDTWKGRPNGLRKDLVQLLYDMHPGFLRFPGGCIVEGRRSPRAITGRPPSATSPNEKPSSIAGTTNSTPAPRPTTSSPSASASTNTSSSPKTSARSPCRSSTAAWPASSTPAKPPRSTNSTNTFSDALDLIEFANGPVTSPWGKLRAQMGHPEPFHLTMIGVGNEQWGTRYVERYKVFAAALKAKHPEIKLVVAAGPFPTGEPFDSMWATWRKLHADIVDEHYYMSPDWFLSNTNRYDHYDRSGPKVFAGEYAAQTVHSTSPDNRNNWQAAISEAAFMTGLERNGDVVQMASYAPLMAHVDAWQWKPDEIWFDNLRSYGTPDYYVQKLFANNTGTRVVPSTPQAEDGLYTSAVIDDRSHELILKVVNYESVARTGTIELGEVQSSGTVKVTTLSSADLSAENSFAQPRNLAPESTSISVNSGSIPLDLRPHSLTVFRVPMP